MVLQSPLKPVLAFSIEPRLYQSPWFQALSVVVAMLCIWSIWRSRLARLSQRFQIQAAERARISREIHDTVLQSVTAAWFEIEVLAGNAPEPLASHLTSIGKVLRESIVEARQSILNLRSAVQQKPNLAQSVRHFGAELAGRHSISFKFRVLGKARRLPATIEDTILRIGQEAIVNVVRHARASKIEVELRYKSDVLFLSVIDDGCGFDQTLLVGDALMHLGIISMRERAANVGGELKITTQPAAGTQVDVIIPINSTQQANSNE